MYTLFFFVSILLNVLYLLFIYLFSVCLFPSILLQKQNSLFLRVEVSFAVCLLAICNPLYVVTLNSSSLAYWQHNGTVGK
jgi:hypothetical protein